MKPLCRRRLEADARKREEYARNLTERALHGAAGRELQAAARLRAKATQVLDQPCPFHGRRSPCRKPSPVRSAYVGSHEEWKDFERWCEENGRRRSIAALDEFRRQKVVA